jgi:hypothetical protein
MILKCTKYILTYIKFRISLLGQKWLCCGHGIKGQVCREIKWQRGPLEQTAEITLGM